MASDLHFFDKLDALRRVLHEHRAPSSALANVESLLRDADVRREFFRNLDRSDWIAPLQEKGYFDHPPSTKRSEGARIPYPTWPESVYLARMASGSPTKVAEIFARIETDNASVIGDMLDAALNMPPDVAATLLPKVRQAAQENTLWLHFKEASDLCVHLAAGGEVDAALTLADALFAPTFEKSQEEPRRRDKYWYRDGLKKVVPALAPQRPQVFLQRLCEWLKASVEDKRHGHVDSITGDDGSCWWRPAIEEHGQNSEYDFAGTMVGFVREGFERAINQGRLSLDQALEMIEPYRYLVFKRIRLHLINAFADKVPELAREAILNRELFDDYRFKHEYAMLAGRCLTLLTPEEKTTWFGWIDDGPDMSDFDASIKRNLGRDATDEDRQSRICYWQFQKLHLVRDHLKGERREFYERMLAEQGEPKMADLNVRTESGWGSNSPMKVEELSEMTFEKAVQTVSSWTPQERGFTAPDVEGLASTFEEYVATNPEAFSSHAHVLENRPAIYVRRFIDQMGKAVDAGAEVDISAVLDLCEWVVARPVEERTTSSGRRDLLVDEDWQWTRDEISQFVEVVCKATSNDAPKHPLQEYRESIWRLLESLYHDRARYYNSHDQSQDDPRVRDYLDLGINSPRGKAVEAALEYARWVGLHLKTQDGREEVVPGGFDAMPEIREMLEWQIVPDNSSFEAMSVIGPRIGLIYWIDKQWLAGNAHRLFDLTVIEESPRAAHGWAAWNTFLVWEGAHIEFYKLLRSQFAYAVEQAAAVQVSEKSSRQPMYHLGEHLIFLYGRGQLGLDDDDGLLRRFFVNSNPDIRRHAVGFVGESLEGSEAPAEVLERFEALWGFYWSTVGRKDAEEKPDSRLFGTWFSCGQFPELWALERLEEFVEVAPTPEPDHAVVEQLAKIAEKDPLRSVRILNRMIRGDREGWHVHRSIQDARRVLETAMKANQEAHKISVALIDYLGRQGYPEFGELLRIRPDQSVNDE